jgi:hypothetical protein
MFHTEYHKGKNEFVLFHLILLTNPFHGVVYPNSSNTVGLKLTKCRTSCIASFLNCSELRASDLFLHYFVSKAFSLRRSKKQFSLQKALCPHHRADLLKCVDALLLVATIALICAACFFSS